MLEEQCQIILGEIIGLAKSMFSIRTAEVNLNTGLEKRKASLLRLSQMLKYEVFILVYSFNLYIDIVCKYAPNQLNALVPLKKFVGLEESSVLVK